MRSRWLVVTLLVLVFLTLAPAAPAPAPFQAKAATPQIVRQTAVSEVSRRTGLAPELIVIIAIVTTVVAALLILLLCCCCFCWIWPCKLPHCTVYCLTSLFSPMHHSTVPAANSKSQFRSSGRLINLTYPCESLVSGQFRGSTSSAARTASQDRTSPNSPRIRQFTTMELICSPKLGVTTPMCSGRGGVCVRPPCLSEIFIRVSGILSKCLVAS